MPDGFRITYRHILGGLPGDCPGHAAIIRTSMDSDAVVRLLTEQHTDNRSRWMGARNSPRLCDVGGTGWIENDVQSQRVVAPRSD